MTRRSLIKATRRYRSTYRSAPTRNAHPPKSPAPTRKPPPPPGPSDLPQNMITNAALQRSAWNTLVALFERQLARVNTGGSTYISRSRFIAVALLMYMNQVNKESNELNETLRAVTRILERDTNESIAHEALTVSSTNSDFIVPLQKQLRTYLPLLKNMRLENAYDNDIQRPGNGGDTDLHGDFDPDTGGDAQHNPVGRNPRRFQKVLAKPSTVSGHIEYVLASNKDDVESKIASGFKEIDMSEELLDLLSTEDANEILSYQKTQLWNMMHQPQLRSGSPIRHS